MGYKKEAWNYYGDINYGKISFRTFVKGENGQQIDELFFNHQKGFEVVIGILVKKYGFKLPNNYPPYIKKDSTCSDHEQIPSKSNNQQDEWTDNNLSS